MATRNKSALVKLETPLAATFAAAKEELWNGEGPWRQYDQQVYICYAINSALASYIYKEQAREIIEIRLGYSITIEDWLRDNKLINYRLDRGPTRAQRQQIQQYRHRWLDALIKEFSA